MAEHFERVDLSREAVAKMTREELITNGGTFAILKLIWKQWQKRYWHCTWWDTEEAEALSWLAVAKAANVYNPLMEGSASWANYMTQCVRNELWNWMTQSIARQRINRRGEVHENIRGKPDRNQEEVVARDFVEHMLAQLTESERVLAVRRLLRRESLREIAKDYGCNKTNIEQKVARIIREIRIRYGIDTGLPFELDRAKKLPAGAV
jgi:RNA polymerase sigma factor (sigma-70 family)